MFTGTALAGCLLVLGAMPVDYFPINQPNFQIPIRIEPSRKAEIKQLILYVSTDEGKHWEQEQVSGPEKDAFVFSAKADGLYWFSVCVVDRQGRCDPPDVTKAAPAQKILVDTVKPLVRIVSAERQGDEIVIEWEVREEHPDLATLKLEYRTPDMNPGQWQSAPLIQAITGKTRFRTSGPAAVSLRLQMMDLAGNAGTAAADVAGLAAASTAAISGAPAMPAGPTITGPALTTVAESARIFQATPGHAEGTPPIDTPPSGLGSVQQAMLAPTSPGRLLASSDAPASPRPDALSPPGIRPLPLPSIQVVNAKQIPIEYQTTKVGPSGLGEVDLWVTEDDGRTWRLHGQDSHLKSPMLVDLPGEGVYGFTIVAKSRAGRGRRPPSSGDLPELRVEVDTTPPSAKLYQPEPDAEHPSEALVITWTATDKNMDANPISLDWAERSEGPWEMIAHGLKNDGHYSWALPKGKLPASSRVYLKLTARDSAGNVGEAVTPEPILVDLVEAEAKITGIAGMGRR